MQVERFRLARLASVGRREEKLNISIKAKPHIIDVDVVVVAGFLLFLSITENTENTFFMFLFEDSLSRVLTMRPQGRMGIQHHRRPFLSCRWRRPPGLPKDGGRARSQHSGLVPAALCPHHGGLAAPSSCC